MKIHLHECSGQFYWHLHADNGKVMARSEPYLNKEDCKKGLKEVQEQIGTAPVEDCTGGKKK